MRTALFLKTDPAWPSANGYLATLLESIGKEVAHADEILHGHDG